MKEGKEIEDEIKKSFIIRAQVSVLKKREAALRPQVYVGAGPLLFGTAPCQISHPIADLYSLPSASYLFPGFPTSDPNASLVR